MEFKSQIFKAPSLTKTPKLKTKGSSSTFSGVSKSTPIPKINYGGIAKAIGSQPGGVDLEKISTPIVTPLATIVSELQAEVAQIKESVANLNQSFNEYVKSNENLLSDTNSILVEVQKQLALDFSMRASEQKKERQGAKREDSRKKFKEEEKNLEKGRIRLGGAISKVANTITAPVKSVFEKVMEFIKTIGTGILINNALKWIQDPENKKKLDNLGNWFAENWKWIVGAGVGILALGPLSSILSLVLTAVSSLTLLIPLVTGMLANPIVLGALAALGAGILIWKGGEWIVNKAAGGKHFREARDRDTAKFRKDLETEESLNSSSKYFIGSAGQILNRNTNLPLRIPEKNGVMRFANINDVLEYKEDGKSPFTPGQISAVKEHIARMKILAQLKKEQDAAFEEFDEKYSPDNAPNQYLPFHLTEDEMKNATPTVRQPTINPAYTEFKNERDKERLRIEQEFSNKLDPVGRRVGGPVKAGKAYQVGETGRELFLPNVDGMIIDNTKTEKIIQAISSGGAGNKISYINLPPEYIKKPPKSDVKLPSTEKTVAMIHNTMNPADPYRMKAPELYGIIA